MKLVLVDYSKISSWWGGGGGGEGSFLVQVRKKNFFAAGWDSLLSTAFPKKTWGKGQSISGRGKKGQFISGRGKKQD